MVKATLSRLLSRAFEESFTIFHQISGIENLLGPVDYTALNVYGRVRVIKLC